MDSDHVVMDDNGVELLNVSATTDDLRDANNDGHQSADKVYTVDDAMEKLGFGVFQVILTAFSGLIWVADAMEFMLLSVLSPAVKCQWDLTSGEEALITSCVFVGFLFGSLFWGAVGDIIGRKKSLFIVGVLILVFGVLSAIPVSPDDTKIPGYPWLVICRLGVGFSAGGVSQVVTFYAEFLPKKVRGCCITMLELWWGIGSIFGAALAVGVMRPEGLGWHWYLGLAAIPLTLSFPLFLLVPESARYYVVKQKFKKAEKVIERIAWWNFKSPPVGRLVSFEEKNRISAVKLTSEVVVYSNGSVSIQDAPAIDSSSDLEVDLTPDEKPLLQEENGHDNDEQDEVEQSTRSAVKFSIGRSVLKQLKKCSNLFTNGAWKTTALLTCIWFTVAWLYYGVVLLTTTLLQYDPHCGVSPEINMTNETCNILDEDDYYKILWTSAAEIPGILLTTVLIEVIGRKLTMASEFLVIMVAFLLLLICTTQIVLTLFLFLIRAFATGVFQVAYVYTPEVYPTAIRATSVGFFSAAARIGAIITPYFAQVLLHQSDYATIALYAGSALIAAVASLFLPVETKGRELADEGDKREA